MFCNQESLLLSSPLLLQLVFTEHLLCTRDYTKYSKYSFFDSLQDMIKWVSLLPYYR